MNKQYFYSKTNQMHQCLKFILYVKCQICQTDTADCASSQQYWSNTLYVSDGLSVHHQELRLHILQQVFVR